MRIRKRQAGPEVGRGTPEAYPRRFSEREAEIATLQFLVTSIRKRHTWDRIKCTMATGVPVFWIVMVALKPFIPSWLHTLIGNVLAMWTNDVSLSISAFIWWIHVYSQS